MTKVLKKLQALAISKVIEHERCVWKNYWTDISDAEALFWEFMLDILFAIDDLN